MSQSFDWRTPFWGFASGLVLALASSAVQAGDAKVGQALAAPCALCHGVNGISTLAEAPNLAGQPEIDLVEQLRNYRSGKRSHDVMSVMAKPLSDADIDNLAAWFGSFQIQVTRPN